MSAAIYPDCCGQIFLTIRGIIQRSFTKPSYADALKALKGDAKELTHETVANKALVQIAAIYKAEEALKKLTAEERYDRRQREVKPLVEAYFAWVHEQDPACILSEKTREGLKYSLNQEKYLRQHRTIASADISGSFVPILQFEKLEIHKVFLRFPNFILEQNLSLLSLAELCGAALKVFLEDGNIPIDNSATERAIRPFTIGRANWHIIDTIHGAEASATIYSLVETAKANQLKIYEYLKHLLTEIPKHMDDTGMDFLEDLLPWSDTIS